MSFGYLGDTSTKIKQQVKNNGIISVSEAYELEKVGQLSGSLELIQSQTVTSSTAAIDFTSIKGDVYDTHFMTIVGFETAGGGTDLTTIRYSTDGGSSFVESGYMNAYHNGYANGTFAENRSTSESGIRVSFNTGTNQGNGYVYLYNLNNSSLHSLNTFHAITDNANMAYGGGLYPAANTVNAIRVMCPTNMDNAIVNLYGVKTQ